MDIRMKIILFKLQNTTQIFENIFFLRHLIGKRHKSKSFMALMWKKIFYALQIAVTLRHIINS